jgi:spore protease
MAQTGMETAEIVRGVVRESRPDLVIAVDALAARNVHRLASTIQLTDTGIHPGSGVGNHRRGMTRENLGVPVIAIGVPTVVGAAAIVHGTVNALVRTLTASKEGSRYGEYIRELDSDSQYELIRELLEPEFGAMFVTPQDMDERICKLSAAIAEGIRRAVERLEEER